MGFPCSISFETVIGRGFEEGTRLKVNNLSKLMKEWREKGLSYVKLKFFGDIQTRVVQTFSLDYDF